jgi:hypothetical protein
VGTAIPHVRLRPFRTAFETSEDHPLAGPLCGDRVSTAETTLTPAHVLPPTTDGGRSLAGPLATLFACAPIPRHRHGLDDRAGAGSLGSSGKRPRSALGRDLPLRRFVGEVND